MISTSKNLLIDLRFMLIILVVISIMGTGCVYTNWAVKSLNYQESYTQRKFVRERSGYIVREELPDYVEVTLITSSNLRKEVEEMMQGFTYEDRLKLAKSSRPVPSWATLNSEKAQSLIKLLQDNSDKLVFKVTLFGSENWVLTSDLEFAFYDENKSCKPVQIEIIKKSIEKQYLHYHFGYERSGYIFSSVVFVFFDDRIENRQGATFTITGKYEEMDFKKLDDLLRSRRAIDPKKDIHYETIFVNYIFPMENFRKVQIERKLKKDKKQSYLENKLDKTISCNFENADKKIKETNNEAIIEFAYYEGIKNQKITFDSEKEIMELINKKQLIKRISCLCKFKGEISSVTSTQNLHEILIVDGKAVKKKSEKSEKDYVIFEGKINLSDKDKNWEWEAFPQLTLLNGKETYIGGSVESTGGTTTTVIITATWHLNKK